MKGLRKSVSLACALSLLFSCLPLYSQQASGAVVLTGEQVQKIRSELSAMMSETALLKMQSENWRADSEAWRKKCEELEEKLRTALQMSENSEKSVRELQEQVQMLRGLLDELRTEFEQLNQSYMRQKKSATTWQVIAGVMAAVVVTEGVLLWIKNK